MALSELRTDAPIQELCDHFGDWFEGGVKNCAGNGARMTKELYPYTSIFSPIRVNRMTIKNRVVMAHSTSFIIEAVHVLVHQEHVLEFRKGAERQQRGLALPTLIRGNRFLELQHRDVLAAAAGGAVHVQQLAGQAFQQRQRRTQVIHLVHLVYPPFFFGQYSGSSPPAYPL